MADRIEDNISTVAVKRSICNVKSVDCQTLNNLQCGSLTVTNLISVVRSVARYWTISCKLRMNGWLKRETNCSWISGRWKTRSARWKDKSLLRLLLFLLLLLLLMFYCLSWWQLITTTTTTTTTTTITPG